MSRTTVAPTTLPETSTHTLPSSLTQVGTVTKYEMRNYFRSRRFFIMLGIALLIGAILSAVVGYYGVNDFASSALGFYAFWWGNSITFIIAINGIFFGGDAISGEFQNKTGYFLVPNPLRRSSIYVGKYLGAFIASMLIFGAYTVLTLANGVYYFGSSIPYQFGESLLFSVLYLASVLGLTFFFSSVFKSSSISILVTAILFLFAFGIIQLLVATFAQTEPWFIITYGAGIIGNVLVDPYPTTQLARGAGPRGREGTLFAVSIPVGLAILLGYLVITAILGLILFERKEFT